MANPPWIEFSKSDGVYALRDAENSLLQVLLTEFHLSRRPTGFHLQIYFDEETPTIRRREGKNLVKRQMPGYPGKVARIQDEIDDVLFRNRDSLAYRDPDFAFRYASGGTLPIVDFGNRTYYCLFYRDVFPVGWNIANGACDSLTELLNPKLAIERELREEVIVLGLDQDPPHDFEFAWGDKEPRMEKEHVEARQLASQFFADEGNIARDFLRAPLPVRWDVSGPDAVQITYGDSNPRVAQGYYLNINAQDFGIEFDRVGIIEMEPNMVLLDGEINNHRLLNRPVGLFEVQKTRAAVSGGSTEFLPDKLFHSGAEVAPVPQDAKGLAKHMVEKSFLAYLRRVGLRADRDVEVWSTTNPKFDLCPVTRQIIRRHLAATKSRVFLSYSHTDTKLAETLERDLATSGIDTWRDITNSGSRQRMDRTIQHAIDNATHVLLLASEAAVESEYVRDELQYANNAKKPGLVLSLRKCRIPLAAVRWRRINFARDYSNGLAELIAVLRVMEASSDAGDGKSAANT